MSLASAGIVYCWHEQHVGHTTCFLYPAQLHLVLLVYINNYANSMQQTASACIVPQSVSAQFKHSLLCFLQTVSSQFVS